MRNIKSIIFGAALLLAGAAFTAVNVQAQGVPAVPPTQTDVVSNLVSASGGSAVATFALNLLPGWHKDETNSFAAKELELEVSPTWKSANASGSTPFVSVGADYFFSRNFGAGADAITFGNGSGSSSLDSLHAFGIGRKDLGNVAGYLLLGGGRDVNQKLFDAEFGAGFEYRYTTGIGLLCDTRYLYLFGGKGKAGADHEFLTRVGLTLHF